MIKRGIKLPQRGQRDREEWFEYVNLHGPHKITTEARFLRERYWNWVRLTWALVKAGLDDEKIEQILELYSIDTVTDDQGWQWRPWKTDSLNKKIRVMTERLDEIRRDQKVDARQELRETVYRSVRQEPQFRSADRTEVLERVKFLLFHKHRQRLALKTLQTTLPEKRFP